MIIIIIGLNRMHNKNQEMPAKQLIKQASSPLLNQHRISESGVYDGLVYLRRANNNNLEMHKKQGTLKKSGIQRQQLVKWKSRKEPILVKNNAVIKQTKKEQSVTMFSKMMSKSKIQPWEKQKKHFSNDYNPEICQLHSQEPNKMAAQQSYCSATRYRKLVEDFEDRIGVGSTGLVAGAGQAGLAGKRHSYRLDMFKESGKLGIEDCRTRTRKPYFFRNHSLIRLG